MDKSIAKIIDLSTSQFMSKVVSKLFICAKRGLSYFYRIIKNKYVYRLNSYYLKKRPIQHK